MKRAGGDKENVIRLAGPYLVITVEPSTIGKMSRCTPSREMSGPPPCSLPAILSISSIKMIPDCSTRLNRFLGHLIHVDQLLSSSCWIKILRASRTGSLRFFVRFGKELSQQLLHVDAHLFHAGAGKQSNIGDLVLHLDFDDLGPPARPLFSCSRTCPAALLDSRLVGSDILGPWA